MNSMVGFGKLLGFPSPIGLSTSKESGQIGKTSFKISVWFRVKAKLRKDTTVAEKAN